MVRNRSAFARVAILLLVCLPPVLTTVLLAANDGTLVEKRRVVLVEIPVQVTVDGKPLRGLTRENFVVLDRGRPQKITGFEVMDLKLEAPEKPEAPGLDPQISVAARRHFLLMFDLGFSRGMSMAKARRAVREWAADALHPWDLVAVAAFEGKSGAKMLLNFTSDRDQIDLALESLGNPRVVQDGGDPLGLELGRRTEGYSLESDTARTGRSDSGDNQGGGIAGGEVNEALAVIFDSAYEPLRRHGDRHDVFDLTRSMRGLAEMMQDVRGRKYVVYLSEGFDSSLIFASDNREDMNLLNQSSERGEYWRIDGTKRFGSTIAQRDLAATVDAFRRADCTIQAIDISGDRDVGANRSLGSRGADGLFYMANETGGDLVRSFNRLDEDLAAMLERTSVTYLLAFQPDGLDYDDSFNKVKVRLKDAPKGARVSHRPGYYDPKPYERQSAHKRKMSAAESVMQGTLHREIGVDAIAASFARDGGGAQVPVLIEIDGKSLTLPAEGLLSLEIYAYALALDGTIGGFFTNQINVDPQNAGERLQRGLKFYGNLELAPGDYSLRVLVRDRESGERGSAVRELQVPEFGDGPLVLPPLFPERRGEWLLARSNAAADQPFPFMFADTPFLPSARPSVEAGGESRMFLFAYNLGDGGLDIRARLEDESGNLMGEPPVRVIDKTEPSADRAEVLMATLDAAAMTKGEYRLIVTVTEDSTGESRSTSLPFMVDPGRSVTDRPVRR